MKTKKFQVRDIEVLAVKQYNEKLGHDRCYHISFTGHDESMDYKLPFYPNPDVPFYMGEIVIASPKNCEVTYYLDDDIKWVTNKPTFNKALNVISDMFIVNHLHKTMIEYSIYQSASRKEFYTERDHGLIWLYYINTYGNNHKSSLIGCFSDENILNYVLRVFELGPEFIMNQLEGILRHTREREA